MIRENPPKAMAFSIGKFCAFLCDDPPSVNLPESGSERQIVAAIRKDTAWSVGRDYRLAICFEQIQNHSHDENWIHEFKRGFLHRDEISESWTLSCSQSEFYTSLQPYTRAVTTDQITQALAGGLSVKECTSRLHDAESVLYEAHNPTAWQRGWSEAVDAIRWLDSDENQNRGDDQTFYGDLRQFADEQYNEIRQGCYSSSLVTGEPVIDVPVYRTACGRCDCLDAGMWFDDGLSNTEIAGILRSTNDIKELKTIAAQHKAVEAYQCLYSTWTPFGIITEEQLRSLGR